MGLGWGPIAGHVLPHVGRVDGHVRAVIAQVYWRFVVRYKCQMILTEGHRDIGNAVWLE